MIIVVRKTVLGSLFICILLSDFQLRDFSSGYYTLSSARSSSTILDLNVILIFAEKNWEIKTCVKIVPK